MNHVKLAKHFLSFSLIASLSMACTPGAHPTTGSKASPNAPTTEAEEKSESLTDEAERLVDPKSLDDAAGKFHEALELNPDNARAIFWSGFLKPLQQLKGILTRIRPLYEQDPYLGAARYEKFLRQTARHYNPAMYWYMKSGPEDIKSSDDLQEWLDRFDDSINEWRASIRKIRDQEISVQIPQAILEDSSFRRNSCTESHFGPIKYRDPNCESGASAPVGLNRGDFDALLGAAGAYQVFLEIWTAYRLNPLAALATVDGEHNSNSPEDFKEFWKSLFQVEHPGAPRARPFHALKDLTSDMTVALRSAIENQRELCPSGEFNLNNRRGFLVSFGICIQTSSADGVAERNLKTVETVLSGRPLDVTDNDGQVLAQVLPLKLADQSLANLQDIGPFQWDACGNVTSFSSSVFDIYFASGNFESVKNRSPLPICNKRVSQ